MKHNVSIHNVAGARPVMPSTTLLSPCHSQRKAVIPCFSPHSNGSFATRSSVCYRSSRPNLAVPPLPHSSLPSHW